MKVFLYGQFLRVVNGSRMSACCKIGVYWTVLCLAIVFSSTANENCQELPQEVYDKLYSCGYNSLYLFLRLKDHQTDFETLKSKVVVKKNGTSLYDLQIAADAVVLQTEIVRCSYPILCAFNMPVIAWINRNPEAVESQEPVIGHFIVLTVANTEGIEYLDGTSGLKSTIKQANFIKQWNGMILKEKNKKTLLSDRMTLSIFLLGIAFILLRWLSTSKKRRNRSQLFRAFSSFSLSSRRIDSNLADSRK